ncbi:MAG: hypothetical protein AAF911_10700 [Planctomycetota bacterium]
MAFSYDRFVADVRDAAASADAPMAAVQRVMHEAVADPAAVASAVPEREDDELHLFEDASVSIWVCRFRPDVVMPAHEHKMPVVIGGFAGIEKSILYRRVGDELEPIGERSVGPGEVITIGADAIHAVTAEGDQLSHALHVYLGELTKVERDLFDEATGGTVPFTDANFEKLKKRKI